MPEIPENDSGLNQAELHSITELIMIQDQIDKVNKSMVDIILKVEQDRKDLPLLQFQIESTSRIPRFWRIVFSEHPVVRLYLQYDDYKILDYLHRVIVEDFKDENPGYYIAFHFKSNPYFEEKELRKTFTFLSERITKITATPITWKKEGYIPQLTKKQKIRPMENQSFFTWFSVLEETETFVDLQDEIADSIKRDIWPNPVSYFESALLDTSFCVDGGEILDDKFAKDFGKYVPNQNLIDDIKAMLRVHCGIQKTIKETKDMVFDVEQLHNEICKPLYHERNERIKNIPDFWTIAFLSHPVLTTFIREFDEQIFKHLTSLEVESIIDDVQLGYTISFNFGPNNKYFTETKLTKTYTFIGKETKITATPITWADGKLDFGTYGSLSPGGDVSFFSWFNVADDRSFKDLGILQDNSDIIAVSIKEDLWLNPLLYFQTGMKSWSGFED